MIEIGELHAGHGLDSKGFIVSDVSIDKIDDIYKPCIQESIEGLKKRFHQQLHSVYLYGSIARGEAVSKVSDVDLIAMFSTKLSSDQLAELKKLSKKLSKKYRSLVRDVGIATAYYKYTIDPLNYYENAFLKELCVCIHGEDMGERFGPYKLTPEIAIRFNGDIHDVLHRTLKRLETASEGEFKILTQNFARKLIRTYYSMVMVRSQIWTTRLHEQAKVFIHYFPEKETMIHALLNWIYEPKADRETVCELLRNESEWASLNFSKEVLH